MPAFGEADEIISRIEPTCTWEAAICHDPYVPDTQGYWHPAAFPTECPFRKKGDPPCYIGVDYLRPRKTGPCFPITVAECRTHNVSFTLYPSGHVPYGRERVAAVSPDGQLLVASQPPVSSEPASSESSETLQSPPAPGASPSEARWQQTRFAAVFDASRGDAWPHEAPGPYWSVQQDRLDELALLLGLDSKLRCGLVSRDLGIPELKLRDAIRNLEQAAGYRERGQVLLSVLQQERTGRALLERVLACGARAGLWGDVHLWSMPSLEGRPPSRTLLPGVGLPDG